MILFQPASFSIGMFHGAVWENEKGQQKEPSKAQFQKPLSLKLPAPNSIDKQTLTLNHLRRMRAWDLLPRQQLLTSTRNTDY